MNVTSGLPNVMSDRISASVSTRPKTQKSSTTPLTCVLDANACPDSELPGIRNACRCQIVSGSNFLAVAKQIPSPLTYRRA